MHNGVILFLKSCSCFKLQCLAKYYIFCYRTLVLITWFIHYHLLKMHLENIHQIQQRIYNFVAYKFCFLRILFLTNFVSYEFRFNKFSLIFNQANKGTSNNDVPLFWPFLTYLPKGRIISKAIFVFLTSPKKRTKTIWLHIS